MNRHKRNLKRLIKRKEWLDKRIADNPNKDLSYDKAESSALQYAIEKLKQEGADDGDN